MKLKTFAQMRAEYPDSFSSGPDLECIAKGCTNKVDDEHALIPICSHSRHWLGVVFCSQECADAEELRQSRSVN